MKIPIIEYVSEFRTRLLYLLISFLINFFLCFFYIEYLIYILIYPYSKLSNLIGKHFIYTNLFEVFLSYLWLSFVIGLILTLPLLFYHVYQFFHPALYNNEKIFIKKFFILSILFFYIGMIFGYYYLISNIWNFSISFEDIIPNMPFYLEPKIYDYLKLVLKIITATGISFQIPIYILLYVNKYKLNHIWLKKKRKFFFVLSFLIGAVLSPPDLFSQILIAVPLIIFYEFIIYYYCFKYFWIKFGDDRV